MASQSGGVGHWSGSVRFGLLWLPPRRLVVLGKLDVDDEYGVSLPVFSLPLMVPPRTNDEASAS